MHTPEGGPGRSAIPIGCGPSLAIMRHGSYLLCGSRCLRPCPLSIRLQVIRDGASQYLGKPREALIFAFELDRHLALDKGDRSACVDDAAYSIGWPQPPAREFPTLQQVGADAQPQADIIRHRHRGIHVSAQRSKQRSSSQGHLARPRRQCHPLELIPFNRASRHGYSSGSPSAIPPLKFGPANLQSATSSTPAPQFQAITCGEACFAVPS